MFNQLKAIYNTHYTSQYSMFDDMVKQGYDKFSLKPGTRFFTYEWEKKNGTKKKVHVLKSPFYDYSKEFAFYKGKRETNLTTQKNYSDTYYNNRQKLDWNIELIDFYDKKKDGGILTEKNN